MPTVPNLVGLGVYEAADARDAAGFTPGAKSTSGSPYTGLVTSQSPVADSTADAGAPIEVTIASTQAGLSSYTIIWGC